MTDATDFLTNARNSLWDAIDNAVELQSGGQSPITKKYKFNDNQNMLIDGAPTGLSDIPAAAIWPTGLIPEQFLQKQQHWPYNLQINVWTNDWVLTTAERYVEHIAKAIYSETTGSPIPGIPWVKAVTGFYPRRLGPFSLDRVHLGAGEQAKSGFRAIHGIQTFELRLPYSPY